MPNGVETFVDEGFAEIQVLDPAKRAEVHNLILEHTPAALIEIDTRKGRSKVYRIPEGNARDAGLIDDAQEGRIPLKADQGYAAALVEANPLTTDKREGGVQHGEYGTILPTVADTAYQAMPTTSYNVHDGDLNGVAPQDANGIIRQPLRPGKNVADPDAMIDQAVELFSKPVVSPPAAVLQQMIREKTINPVDYAPTHVPRDQRVPVAQATIAATVDRAPRGAAEPPSGFGIGPNAGRVVEGGPEGDPGVTVTSAPDIITEQHEQGRTVSAPSTTTVAVDDTGYPTGGTRVDDMPEPADDLDSKTVPDLKALAKERKIDLDGATKKADIIAKLRG